MVRMIYSKGHSESVEKETISGKKWKQEIS